MNIVAKFLKIFLSNKLFRHRISYFDLAVDDFAFWLLRLFGAFQARSRLCYYRPSRMRRRLCPGRKRENRLQICRLEPL